MIISIVNVTCEGYHGTNGPMRVSDLEKTPLVDVFLEGGRQIGCPTLDVNGPKQLGMIYAWHQLRPPYTKLYCNILPM